MNRYTITLKFLILTTLLSCAPVSQTLAESGPEQKSYWYGGFGLTASDLSINEANLSNTYAGNSNSSFETGGNAFKLFAGYQVDPLLGVETGIITFGEIVMDTDQNKRNLFSAETLYIAATASLPVSNNIEAKAKIGMSFWDLYDNNNNSIETGQGLNYGAGLDFNLYGKKERSLLIEWEHHNFSGVALKESDSVGVSIIFRF